MLHRGAVQRGGDGAGTAMLPSPVRTTPDRLHPLPFDDDPRVGVPVPDPGIRGPDSFGFLKASREGVIST